MITIKQLNDLKLVRASCEEGMDGRWDCGTAEGRKAFQPMIDDLDAVIIELEANDWYTPCVVLCCWLMLEQLYTISGIEVKPVEAACELIPLCTWDKVKDMLRTRERNDETIWAFGTDVLELNIDIPDHVWGPFNVIYELCDPEFGNHSMN